VSAKPKLVLPRCSPFIEFHGYVCQELLFKRGRISENLTEEITLWESLEYQAKNLLMVELPFPVSSSVPTMSDLTIEQHQQRRKELARRLGEMNARKREQRV
jgi:actin-related protein 5